jgi:phosphate-selective porin OprO/OprP
VLRPTSDNADGQPIYSGRGYSLTARVTGLPYYEQKGARLLHLGLSYSYRKSNDDDLLRYMTRPEDHFIEFPFLDVTMQNVRNVNLFGAEAAAVLGPFSAQAEFVSAVVDNVGHFVVPEIDVTQTADRGPCFNAFYAQASYFLTGEHRPYDTASGAFTRVRPIRNFREGGGWGAVEVAARYSFIDLDREDLTTFGVENPGTLTPRGIQTFASRGELNDVTLGVNWYLNPNTKVSANYIRSCPGRIDTSSSADIFMMRFQVDF